MNTIQNNQEKQYTFVKKNPGTWGINKYFFPLNPAQDEDGWWFEPEQFNEINNICLKTNGTLIAEKKELPLLANNLEEYRPICKIEHYNEKSYEAEEEARQLLIKNKIITKNDVILSKEHLEILSTIEGGEKLFQDIKKYDQKKEQFKNEFNIANIKPAQKTNINESHNFDYLLKNNSEQELIDELKNITPGINVGYQIGDIDLVFPGGAISILVAPTSHGKTTALINFCLEALNNLDHNQSIYFFTYEESKASILSLFLNTWISKKLLKISIHEPISKNNRRSIDSYFRGTDEYITTNMRYEFLQHKNNFFKEIIDTGRLKIIYSDMPSSDLVEAIYYIKTNTKVSLVCIDYMQLLKFNHNYSKLARHEELKQICLQLKDCAINTGLPILLTAQFNRTVVTEGDMSPVNIGEAGDIERVASLIIGMYNRNFEMTKGGNTNRDGEKINKKQEIIFEILKGRGIGNGHLSVMFFDGNRGLIFQEKLKTKNSLF